MEKTYLTQAGYEKLAADLDFLLTVKRREIAVQLDQARSHGDLRENAEYEAAKHAQQLNEIRIRELQEKISTAEIINTDNVTTDKVVIGTVVTVWDFKYEEEEDFEITVADEADPANGKISVNSPVASALVGKSVGDVVEVIAPKGTMKYEIRKIGKPT